MIEPGVASPPEQTDEDVPAPHGRQKKIRSRSQIGRTNAAKGKAQERKVVAYLRVNGWPGAERTVRTGYRVSGRTSRDRGDIDGTPGIAWQIKDVAEREWWRIPTWMNDTHEQAQAARADFGVLVVRRAGHAHPGEWWVHMYLHDVVGLLGFPHDQVPPQFPIRFEFHHLLPILRDAGYGTPRDEEVSA